MTTQLMSAVPLGTDLGATPALAPAAQTQFLERDGGRIAYDDTGGNGALILALPGMVICGRSIACCAPPCSALDTA